MDLIDLFWDMHQQRRLGQHDEELSHIDGQIANQRNELDGLRRDVANLTHIVHALAGIIAEKGLATEAEVVARTVESKQRLQERAKARECSGCGRMIKPVAGRCLYCGTPGEPTGA